MNNPEGDVFRDDLDYRNFLKLLGDFSGRTGWRVHSYVLTVCPEAS